MCVGWNSIELVTVAGSIVYFISLTCNAFAVSCPESDGCKRCCMDEKGSCFPLLLGAEKNPLYVADGMPCVNGTCDAKVSILHFRQV